jgi:hypothetical protein
MILYTENTSTGRVEILKSSPNGTSLKSDYYDIGGNYVRSVVHGDRPLESVIEEIQLWAKSIGQLNS